MWLLRIRSMWSVVLSVIMLQLWGSVTVSGRSGRVRVGLTGPRLSAPCLMLGGHLVTSTSTAPSLSWTPRPTSVAPLQLGATTSTGPAPVNSTSSCWTSVTCSTWTVTALQTKLLRQLWSSDGFTKGDILTPSYGLQEHNKWSTTLYKLLYKQSREYFFLK